MRKFELESVNLRRWTITETHVFGGDDSVLVDRHCRV